jgi:ribose 5-phosphate isomerase B
MIIALGADHGGYALKEAVKAHLLRRGIEFIYFGSHSGDRCDYPDMALPVATAVVEGRCERGLLFCGTGIGISIAANKMPGVRAAVCSDSYSAKYTRLHNDANILCLGGRVVGEGLALDLVDLFLDTEFEGGRHADRIAKITNIEQAL